MYASSYLNADASCQSKRQWAVFAPPSAAHWHSPSGVSECSHVQHRQTLETDDALALKGMLQAGVDHLQSCTR